jgi:hypothetical protein
MPNGLAGSLLLSAAKSRTLQRVCPIFRFNPFHQESVMLAETIVSAPPVLAAGWSLLYLLFGGGLGGAVLIFLGLKLVGR